RLPPRRSRKRGSENPLWLEGPATLRRCSGHPRGRPSKRRSAGLSQGPPSGPRESPRGREHLRRTPPNPCQRVSNPQERIESERDRSKECLGKGVAVQILLGPHGLFGGSHKGHRCRPHWFAISPALQPHR